MLTQSTLWKTKLSPIISNGNVSTVKPAQGPGMGKQLVSFIKLRLQVKCTLFCNLQNRARTQAVLVIGLYELLSNPTTAVKHRCDV
jgi:hypothetical protein